MGHFHFIFGGAGCGKSSYIYRKLTERTLEEPDRRFYLFVPEQNTLKAQQELIRHSPVLGMLTLDVLSFTQLSYRVMEELDIPAPDVLDEISKSVLLRKALTGVKDELTVYKNKTGSRGFISQLKSALSEFAQYGVGAGELSGAAETASSPLLRGKLSDLEKILTAFRELKRSENKNHVIPEEVPELLLKNMDGSRLLDGAVLYFDGFTGFTPLQLSILGRMAEKAEELWFAVTLPEEKLHTRREHYTDLFWLSRETVKKVTDVCNKAGISEGGSVNITDRNAKEKRISDRLTVPENLEVQLAGFPDPTEEVRYTAAKIRERALAGGRYRRMAVAVSELASYREIIRREFTAAGLSFFLDDADEGAGSPVLEFLRSSLLSIAENYAFEDVMTYLKNPLVSGRDREITDILENFVRAAGIRGRKAWESDWRERQFIPSCAGDRLEELEAKKQEYLQPLFRLQDALKEEKTCGGKAACMQEFLTGCIEKIAGTHSELEQEETPAPVRGTDPQRASQPVTGKETVGEVRTGQASAGQTLAGQTSAEQTQAEQTQAAQPPAAQIKLTSEDLRFAELSAELFDRLSSLFSEEEVSIREFTELAEAGFSDMKAGMIPAGLDSVSVGDLKRSRFDDIDDLYLLGANEGKIPQTVSGGGIFTDRERMELEGMDLELAPDDRHDASIQNFYLYLYLHKPAKSLTVSFSAAGRDGSRQKPSEILANASLTYPETEPVTGSGLLAEFTELLEQGREMKSGRQQKEAAGNAAGETAEKTALSPSSRNSIEEKLCRDWKLLTEDPELETAAKAVLAAALCTHEPENLTPETAGLLYGTRPTGSVTRLENFENCPYRHFLTYGLKCGERESFDVEAVDAGRLYHDALDGVLRELKAAGKDLSTAAAEEVAGITERKVRELTENYNGSVMQETARNRYVSEQIRRITLKTLEKLAAQYRLGDFRTLATEQAFQLNCGEMKLYGRIDRMDQLETEGKTYVKVIDYKSGSTPFDLGLCYEGLQMQLAAYMDAALTGLEEQGKPASPAGMFLYHIKDPVLPAGQAEDESPWQMEGVCIDDPEILKRMDRSLETDDASAVIPVKLKDGIPHYTSSVLGEEEFRLLLKRNREKMEQDAVEILKGKIEARPMADGKKCGCDYCPMGAVCGFDRRIPGYGYRYINPPKKSDVTEKLREELN